MMHNSRLIRFFISFTFAYPRSGCVRFHEVITQNVEQIIDNFSQKCFTQEFKQFKFHFKASVFLQPKEK